MWAVYVLLALLALVLVVLSVPVTGRITYDGTLTARIRVLGVPVPLYPRPLQEDVPQPKRKRRSKADKPSKWQELKDLLKQDDVAGTLHFISGVARLAGRTVGRLLRSITVTRLQLQLLIATGDPADTAQRYGQVCGVLYPALELIGQQVRIRRRQLRVEPNFLLEQGSARFDIRFRVSVWRLTGAGMALLWGFLLLREDDRPQINKEVS